MKKQPMLALRVLAALAASAVCLNVHAQCNVYMTQGQQVIDGFGFSTAWCGTLTTAKNQSLYGTLGMSLLRIQIVSDMNGANGAWNDGANDAAAAHSYGVKVFGSDWYGPNGWDDANLYLLPQYYGANAVFLAKCAQYSHLDWVSPSNEPDLGWQMWTTNQFIQWTTKYGASIGVPLVMPESCWFSEPYSQAIANNPNVPSSLIPIAAGHSYGVSAYVHSAEIAAGKHVWMTEYYIGNGQDQVAGEAVPIAQNISQYMNNQFNAYVWWWVYTSDAVCNLVENNGTIHKNGYAMGQFAKWVRPGSTKVAADFTPQANVNVTAYNAYANGAVVIVAVNANNTTVSQSFSIHNSSATVLEGYQTSTNNSMTDIGSFAVSGGNFTASLPAQSITTFVQTNAIPANLPPLWAAQDIGSVGIVGSTTYSNTVGTNGVFTMTASGTDIGSTADAFRFVCGTNAGNCTILARVSAEQSLNPMAKAGVMIRSGLAANAANAFVGLTPAGVMFQYRSSAGGGTSSNLVSGVSAPCWVKLVQSGSAFTGYYSADGATWTQAGTTTFSMSGMEYAGLAFCNSGNSSLGSATFDNVSAPFWPIVPPPTPTGLTATAGVEQVSLTWQQAGYATNYNVLRGAASGGPYTNIAAVMVPGYVDTDLAGGTTYYYQVNAGNSAGRSANSAPASGMPTVGVLSPWVAQDIGAYNLPGSEFFTNGVFTMYASGADIWNNADAFRFTYVATNNANFTIVARVKSVQSINSWSKAGVMVRSSLDAGAANAFIAVTPSSGVTFQYRSSEGGTTSYSQKTGLTAPYWVKLAGSGGTFTGYYSPDGVNWTQLGSAALTLPSTVYAGLADTSHDTTLLCTATFDNVNAPGFMPALASVPGGLVATAGIEQVALRWLASSNATSYNVYRSTQSGGPYTPVANVTATNYTDIQLASSTTYYYVVTAANSLAGESANSAQASATTTATMPSPWVTQDIGAPAWGSASYTNGLFTVTGSGADIWNAADSFRFVYVKTNSTYFTMVARVASLQNINSWSKAGVMIRDSLNPGAANAFIGVTPGNGVTFQYRSSDGGGCNNTTVSGSAPYWVKLVGSNTTFTAYSSTDGASWTQVGSTTLTNITTAYIGLAVTSHNNPSLCAATFDNVIGPGWPNAAPPPAPASLTATPGNALASFRWLPSSTASSYNVKRGLTNGGPYGIVANVATTNCTDTGLVNGTTYYYVVSALNTAGESANSLQASVTPQNPAPTGLSATAISGTQVSLVWNVFSNTATYNLKRSTTNGGPYAVIASGLSATNYLDSGLTRGTTYYYVVSAVVGGNETLNSTQAWATAPLPFSATWTNNLAGGTGNWSVAGNWNVGIPLGVGDSATLGIGSGLSTVRLDLNATLSSLTFTNPNSFVVADMGSVLTLDGSGGGARLNVTNGTANVIASAVSLNDNLSAYVSSGKSLSISGVVSNAGAAKTLTVNGPGTLALSGNNSYGPAAGSAGTTLSGGGTLQVGHNNALGRGDLSVTASGTIRAGAAVSLSNNLALGAGATLTVDNNGYGLGLGGVLSGSGALTKTGAGILTLTSAASYAGDTTLNTGTLQCGAANLLPNGAGKGNVAVNVGGTLDLNGFDLGLNGLSGSGIVDNLSAATATLSVGNNNASSAFGGAIRSSGGAANLNLLKSGSGTLSLSGTNTFSGYVQVSGAGTLSVSSISNALGRVSSLILGGGSASGRLLYTGAGEATERILTFNATQAGASQVIDQSGSGLLKFTSDFAYTGSVSNVLTLQGSTSGAGEFAGNIGGGTAMALVKSGTGTWTLSGNNTYAGGTTLNGGRLNLASAAALGTGPFTNNASSASLDNTSGQTLMLANHNAQYWNGDLNFIGSSDLNLGSGPVVLDRGHQVAVANGTLTVGGGISIGGSGALTNAGPGSLVLLGTNNSMGDLWLLAGTFTVGDSGTLGGGGYNGVITDNALFNYASSAAQFVTNGIAGSGSLTVSGSGTLTLLGANSYSGGTLISSGSLRLGASASLASTPIITVPTATVMPGATLDVSAVTGGFTLGAGQWLSGGGSVAGDVTVADDFTAWVYPNGTWGQSWAHTNTLSFGGNLSFGPSSTLEFDLSSSSAGANDSICLTGAGAVLEGNGAGIWIFAPELEPRDYVLFRLSGEGATVASGFSSVPLWDVFEPAHSERYSIQTMGQTVALHYEPFALTVTNLTVKSKPYDGTTAATLDVSGARLVGVNGGDVVGLDSSHYTANFASAGSSAGSTNVPVSVTGLGLSGPQALYYSLTQPTGLTGNILPGTVAGWPYITEVSFSGGTVTLMGTNVAGAAGHAYEVWSSSSLTAARSGWTPVTGSSNVFGPDGGFTSSFPAPASTQFYIIEAAP